MEIVVIVIIGILQFGLFAWNYSKLRVFKIIYPDTITLQINLSNDFVQGIISEYNNSVFRIIISSINKYLINNKGQVSDYHLIKDIVDRNTEAKEDEIDTQIPLPLYLGLVGTMICILIGLKGLNLTSVVNGENSEMINGISPLLSGVAVAMITSIIGICLTTIGSWLAKEARIKVEGNKNTFMSWIQAELLPNLSNDTAQTLQKLSRSLVSFNKTFSFNTNDFNNAFAQNTNELRTTFSIVSNTYRDLSKILAAINNMNIHRIASANIEVYDKLKNCTDEIGKLGVYLQGLNQYQADTTTAIEKLNTFFDKGIERIDETNIGVKNALERFSQNSDTYLGTLQEKLDGQILNVNSATNRQQEAFQKYSDDISSTLTNALKLQNDELLKHFTTVSSQMQTAANEQKEIFKQKLNETSLLVDELKKLTDIKKGIENFEKATKEQNGKIEELTRSIHKLAQKEISGGSGPLPIPKWVKITVVTVASLVSVTCLAVLIPLLIGWVTKLI